MEGERGRVSERDGKNTLCAANMLIFKAAVWSRMFSLTIK